MVYSEGWMQLPSIKVFYRTWKSDNQKGVVCGIHGFAEDSSRYSRLGRFLSENGFSLFMYDLRGHGKTAFNTKDFGYVKSFDFFVHDTRDFISEVVRRTAVKDIILFGHSLGGLITLHYLARVKDYVSFGITSGAATITSSSLFQKYLLLMLNKVAPRTRVKLPIKAEDLTHDKMVYSKYLSDNMLIRNPTVRLLYDVYAGSKEIWKYLPQIDAPMLMMHGELDRVVHKEATEKAFGLISSRDKQLAIYKGLYHEILNEENNQTVYYDLIKWLSNRIK